MCQIQISNFKSILFQHVGNQGVQRQRSLNLNLKGGKLLKLGNQGVGRQKSLNLNLKDGKLIKLENQGVERQKSLYLNFVVLKWTKMGKRWGNAFFQIFLRIIKISIKMNCNGKYKYGPVWWSTFLSLNLEDQIDQCMIKFSDGVESLQDQRSGLNS